MNRPSFLFWRIFSSTFRFLRKRATFSTHRFRLTFCTISLDHYENKPHWSVYNMAAPGNRMRWDIVSSDVSKKADELMAKSKAVYDAVGALSSEDISYDNSVKVV